MRQGPVRARMTGPLPDLLVVEMPGGIVGPLEIQAEPDGTGLVHLPATER